jgi:hypothetical protein
MTDTTEIQSLNDMAAVLQAAHESGQWALISPAGQMWVGSLELVSKALLDVIREGLPQGVNNAH